MTEMNPQDIDRSGLVPQIHHLRGGQPLYLFYDKHIDIVRLDLVFEAGTALQDKFLQAASAIQLITEGTPRHTAQQIAEFMDFRGIIIEKNCDTVRSTLTAYCLSRYIGELLPLLYECVTEAVYPQTEFDVFATKRKQQLMTAALKPSHVARCRFYEGIYGHAHPLGRFATSDDVDLLTVDDIRRFHKKYYDLSRLTVMMGGNVPADAVALVDSLFGNVETQGLDAVTLPPSMGDATGLQRIAMDGAVQAALRVGRELPYRWGDIDYSRFMVLNTILGGYFGSRLMTNIREDKGYTYGIYSQTHLMRGSILFYIVSEVAVDKVDATMTEIERELSRLIEEPVPAEELKLVKTCMLGDFMRSVDGVFERMERFASMASCGISEQFTDTLFGILGEDGVTSDELQRVASTVLDKNSLLMVAAG